VARQDWYARVHRRHVAQHAGQDGAVAENPQAVIPGNAMPNMNLNDAQARHITAYLSELQ
jgi:cytochrome c1